MAIEVLRNQLEILRKGPSGTMVKLLLDSAGGLGESNDHHWAEHGREELLHKASRTDRHHGSDRLLRPRRGSDSWNCGWHFHEVDALHLFEYISEINQAHIVT